jgi:tetratricopeptide (TPR) repeat protein
VALARVTINVLKKPATATAQPYAVASTLALTALHIQSGFHEIVHSPPNILLGVFAVGVIAFISEPVPPANRDGRNDRKGNLIALVRESGSAQMVLYGAALFLVLVFWPFFSLKVFLGEVYYGSAVAAMETRDFQKAEKQISTALRMNAGQAYYRRTLGDLLMQRFERSRSTEDLRGAERAFLEAAALNPLDPQLHYNLGDFYRYVTAISDAGSEIQERLIRFYRQAVEMDPFNVHFRARLTTEYLKRGRAIEARDMAQECIRLEPEFLAGIYLMKEATLALGDEPTSREMGERLDRSAVSYVDFKPNSLYERLLRTTPEMYFAGESLSSGVGTSARSTGGEATSR